MPRLGIDKQTAMLQRVRRYMLVYEAVFLPFVVIMQTVSGGDYTAAYTVGGAAASVELILCALIKREENKQNKKSAKADDGGMYE